MRRWGGYKHHIGGPQACKGREACSRSSCKPKGTSDSAHSTTTTDSRCAGSHPAYPSALLTAVKATAVTQPSHGPTQQRDRPLHSRYHPHLRPLRLPLLLQLAQLRLQLCVLRLRGLLVLQA